jgi:hypothetical protein
MMRGEESADHIRKAHNLVAKAAKCWNAGNLAAVEECVAALEESAVELRFVEAAAVGNLDSLRGFRSEILEMKERVVRIERLSDLAAAFLRRGPESAGDSPLYRAGGFEDSGSPVIATTMIQA